MGATRRWAWVAVLAVVSPGLPSWTTHRLVRPVGHRGSALAARTATR